MSSVATTTTPGTTPGITPGTTPGTGTRRRAVMHSPIGPLTLVADAGALVGVYMSEHRHRPALESLGDPAPDPAGAADPAGPAGAASVLAAAQVQLGEYLEGRRTVFDLPVQAVGTPFQRSVWAQLALIPYGEVITYGELAARLGRPGAARAVGLANGRNPVSIVVPCHRVIGGGGALTGYGGGLERKRFLLALERGTDPAALF